MTMSCIDPGTVCRQQTSVRTFSIIHKAKPGIYYNTFLITISHMTILGIVPVIYSIPGRCSITISPKRLK